MSQKIAIIILNWNGLENSRECLISLKKITYPSYKIIFIDNGSKINEAEILAKEFQSHFSEIRFIRNEKNLGFAQGNNQGITEALKDQEVGYVCTLNNDTIVELNFLDEAIKKFLDPQIGMIAMKVINYYEQNKIDSLGMTLTQSGLTFNNKIQNTNDKLQNIFCPCGSAALYSRQLLEKCFINENEYFDKDFFCYAEDFDLGFRGRLAGFDCLLADEAIVYHKVSASTSEKSDLAVFYTYRNICWTLIKDLPFILWLKYLPKIIIGQLLIIFLYFLRRKYFLILNSFFL